MKGSLLKTTHCCHVGPTRIIGLLQKKIGIEHRDGAKKEKVVTEKDQ